MQREFDLKLEEGESGIWFCTSETEPPLFVARVGLDAMLNDLPTILRNWIGREPKS